MKRRIQAAVLALVIALACIPLSGCGLGNFVFFTLWDIAEEYFDIGDIEEWIEELLGELDDEFYDDEDNGGGIQWSEGELGSARELSGNVVIVSIYADGESESWDFSTTKDREARDKTVTYLDMACTWLEDQCTEWGRDVNFIYDWDEHPELYYETELSTDFTHDDNFDETPTWRFIDNQIDNDAIYEDLDADSVIYMVFINSGPRCENVSCTRDFYPGMDYNYEIVYIYNQSYQEVETPATYAHEILHTFGAPDLYNGDMPASNYGITERFVEHVEAEHYNEIMYTTYYVRSDGSETPVYDRITNVFTELTAYYVGLTDTCQDVEDWGLQPSQYDFSGRYGGNTPSNRESLNEFLGIS